MQPTILMHQTINFIIHINFTALPPPEDILLVNPFTYVSGKLRGTILG
jgi:hypothetical protein